MNKFLEALYENKWKYARNKAYNMKKVGVPRKVLKKAEVDAGLWEGRLACLREEYA